MMMQWRKSQQVPYISYQELRTRFEIGSKEYERMSNFKSSIRTGIKTSQ